MRKNKKFFLISLIAITFVVGFYLLYPKYQFIVRDDAVYKLNRITGSVEQHFVSVEQWVNARIND